MTNQVPAILADTIQSVAVHNGITRIVLGRLDASGHPLPVLELLIPTTQAHHLARAVTGTTPARPAAPPTRLYKEPLQENAYRGL